MTDNAPPPPATPGDRCGGAGVLIKHGGSFLPDCPGCEDCAPATPTALTEAEIEECARVVWDAVRRHRKIGLSWRGFDQLPDSPGVGKDVIRRAVREVLDGKQPSEWELDEHPIITVAVLATAAAIRQRKQPATPGELSAATMDALNADLAAMGELRDTEPSTPVCDGCDGDGVVYHAECSVPGCDHEEPCPLCSGEPATPGEPWNCGCPSLPCAHFPRGYEPASKYMDEASAIVAARIARNHPFAPGTVLGHRQAWLREAIACAIEGKPAPPFVEPATPGGEVALQCNGKPPSTPCRRPVEFVITGVRGGPPAYRCLDCYVASVRERNEAWAEAHREREVSRGLRAEFDRLSRALAASEEARKAAEQSLETVRSQRDYHASRADHLLALSNAFADVAHEDDVTDLVSACGEASFGADGEAWKLRHATAIKLHEAWQDERSQRQLAEQDAERWHRLFDEGATLTAAIEADRDRLRAELATARERLGQGRLFEVQGAIVAQQPRTFLWHVTRQADEGHCEALCHDGKWVRFNPRRGPDADCAYQEADAAFAALATRGSTETPIHRHRCPTCPPSISYSCEPGGRWTCDGCGRDVDTRQPASTP